MHYKATRPVVQGNKTVYSEGDISTGPSVKDMLYPFRLGAECVAHPLVWSHGASVRQLSFYGPVSLYLGILSLFGFQGATEAV